MFELENKVARTPPTLHRRSCDSNALLKANFVTAMDKIQLCDGQVHRNDVDETGWSVFALAAGPRHC